MNTALQSTPDTELTNYSKIVFNILLANVECQSLAKRKFLNDTGNCFSINNADWQNPEIRRLVIIGKTIVTQEDFVPARWFPCFVYPAAVSGSWLGNISHYSAVEVCLGFRIIPLLYNPGSG